MTVEKGHVTLIWLGAKAAIVWAISKKNQPRISLVKANGIPPSSR